MHSKNQHDNLDDISMSTEAILIPGSLSISRPTKIKTDFKTTVDPCQVSDRSFTMFSSVHKHMKLKTLVHSCGSSAKLSFSSVVSDEYVSTTGGFLAEVCLVCSPLFLVSRANMFL